jgi:flagellar M-ring protein FliF
MDRINLLWENLASLGSRKLAALALAFALIVSVLGVSAYYLSRPNLEILYAGLDRSDVSLIGSVLKSAGIHFDVSPDGTAVSAPYGQTAQARMLLAERGLPQSANAGYELFDKVGALGLTSFMQEVTRVRALEGELARTIQLMRGVKAARVHIVMPDEGSFRRAKQPPSASVVLRTEGPDDSSAAQAIRHLVAASLPGMTTDQVTVLNTDGMILLSSDGDPTDAVPAKTLSLENAISKEIQDNIRRTLTPYLRLSNFQVSVRARVNTDRRQTNETIFDPDSKVERSVRTVKETSLSQNNANTTATSVERNIPQDRAPATDGKQSNDEAKKSEQLTNFEVSTKTITTTSGGYAIENLSVAILVNRSALADPSKPAPKPEEVERQLKEIEQLAASAAGVRKERGDVLKISAVDFMFNDQEMAPVEAPGLGDALRRHIGAIINAATILIVTGLIVAFGLTPVTRALLAAEPVGSETIPALTGMEAGLELPSPFEAPGVALPSEIEALQELPSLMQPSAKHRLEGLINADELHAALVLKSWMRSDEYA